MKKRSLALMVLAVATPALAHSWYSDVCCSGQDCAEIYGVRITPAGYVFSVGPGEHPAATTRTYGTIPLDSPVVKKSQDGNFHICLAPYGSGDPGVTGQRVRCLYVPDMLG